jgi:hypothetical protein
MTVPSLMANKLQTPNTKHQKTSKIQARIGVWPRTGADWSLVLGLSLELGVWSLVFSLFVHNPNDHPADRTFIVADGFARGEAIRRNDDALVHSRAMSVNGHLRRAFRAARLANRLADHQPPTLEARMLAGGRQIAFNARE